MNEPTASLKRTPLFDEHIRLNGKMVPFAGYEMPVQYPTGIRAEHETVRSRVGIFDVSHMGEFRVRGPDAVAFASRATTNDPAKLVTGQVQYSTMCMPDGGVVDDLLVYRIGEEDLRLVVNASNMTKDWDHLSSLLGDFDAEMEDESDTIGLLALQGPFAEGVLQPLTETNLAQIGFYHFMEGEVAGVPGMISRTGYTGEDGFELYVPAEDAAALWRRIEDQGVLNGLAPAGLGARDSLRLEMGYALYGNDLDDETSPLEAGLSWLVKLNKGDFVGREALQRQKDEGVRRRLAGFELTHRGFPRPGYEVRFRGESVGTVRSGTMSPSLGHGIGTAYLPPDAQPGDPVEIVIRDQAVEGVVSRPPFYKDGSLKR
jgi:aminomethyltransferase